MDEAASEAFELRLMQDPQLAEMVEADAVLGIGMRDLAEKPAATVPNMVPLVATAPRHPTHLPYLLAASVMLVVGFGAGREFGAQRLPSPVPAPLVYVDTTRGATHAATLKIPPSGPLILAVPLLENGCLPDVVISSDGTELRSAAAPDASGYASVLLDAAQLRSGNASIGVLCSKREVARYAVDFTR